MVARGGIEPCLEKQHRNRLALNHSVRDTRIFSPLLYPATASPRYLARAFVAQKKPLAGLFLHQG